MKFKIGIILTVLFGCSWAAPWSDHARPQTSWYDWHSANPIPTPTSAPTTTASGPVNPCAAIASMVAGAPNTSLPRVPAQLGLDCLNDVPLDAAAAIPWLNSLRPYFDWQTTSAYLRNPPEGYPLPGSDIYGELDNIISGVENGRFSTEYELEYALYELFQRTYDGHFRYYPNLVYSVITFGRPISLVSVSPDGYELPKPYVYTDILYSLNSSISISPIKAINGQDAFAYLEFLSLYGSLNDRDALYNVMFHSLQSGTLASLGQGPGGFAGAGRGSTTFPNRTTVLEFENGTITTFENFATVKQNFTGITNGNDVYSQYVHHTTLPNTTTSALGQTPTPRPGYPQPVIGQVNNFIGGYYLTDSGYEDVAVLSIPSFIAAFKDNIEVEYRDTAFNFINQAKADGKTKLVIDVSDNGGGDLFESHSLFENLFPDIRADEETRFRAHEAFNIIGQTVSDVLGTYPPTLNESDPNFYWYGFPFNYRADLDINFQNFTSWPDKYGPTTFHGDNFTEIIRWNFNDTSFPFWGGMIVNGYLNRSSIVKERPFAAENIVILSNGYCASACSTFSEFMRQQGRVKTIAIGGRPQANAPMQPVGGVRGRNDYLWVTINSFVRLLYALAPDRASYFNGTVLAKYLDDTPFLRGDTELSAINTRDGIRRGDTSGTPLQFLYETAECRIWYTAEMTVDVTAQWRRAADVAWNGQSCAWGSISGNSKAKGKRDALMRKKKISLSEAALRELEESIHRDYDPNAIRGSRHVVIP